jgi:hypothetical protein
MLHSIFNLFKVSLNVIRDVGFSMWDDSKQGVWLNFVITTKGAGKTWVIRVYFSFKHDFFPKVPTSKKNPINVHMQLESLIFFFFEGLGLGVELYIKMCKFPLA